MTEYVVYLDRTDHREHKIHLTTCPWYLRHLDQTKAGNITTTTIWKGPYRTEYEAKQATQVTRFCQDCALFPTAIPPSDADTPQRGVVVTDIDVPFPRIMIIVFQWGLAIFVWYLIAVLITVLIMFLLWSSIMDNN